MRIRIITPIVTQRFSGVSIRSEDKQRGIIIERVAIERGPASIECEFDEALAAPDVIARTIEAERDGCDAVVVNCFGDPGIKAAREAVGIPVLGPGESSMHLAAILGDTFSVVTVLDNVKPVLRNNARLYGAADHLASVRAVNIPVLDLHTDESRMRAALVEEAARAVQSDGAAVIVLGCTGMTGLAEEVQAGLVQRGLTGIPVIDPLEAAIQVAEALVNLKVTHSKRTYAYPPAKTIVGYDQIQAPKPLAPVYNSAAGAAVKTPA